MAAVLVLTACDQRFNPLEAVVRAPPIDAPTGVFSLRLVNEEPLPHVSINSKTTYRLLSGGLQLNDDSTWLFHTVTQVIGEDGTILGTSPANYAGKWSVSDTVVQLGNPSSGRITIRNDTLYWTGGPKQSWEAPLTFALTK